MTPVPPLSTTLLSAEGVSFLEQASVMPLAHFPVAWGMLREPVAISAVSGDIPSGLYVW